MEDAPVYYSLIADGNHTHKTVQRIAYRGHPRGKSRPFKEVTLYATPPPHICRVCSGDRCHGWYGNERRQVLTGGGRESGGGGGSGKTCWHNHSSGQVSHPPSHQT